MRESIITTYLTCASCSNDTLQVTAFDRDGDEVMHGVAICDACRAWYRIEDGLLELLPTTLRNAERDARFTHRFASHWDGFATSAEGGSASLDWHKLGQKEFYDGDATNYETDMLK